MNPNEEFFNSLVSQYSERLYWHVRGIVGSHDDADDVVQNTFLKAWKALPSFRGDADAFTWLWRIATNESLSHLRRELIRSFFVPVDEAASFASSSDFDGDELQARFQAAIATLPARQRAVFTMRYYEDLPYGKIAEITGVSEGALKASYHVAREKIEKIVGGD